jgi:hypothetical protein
MSVGKAQLCQSTRLSSEHHSSPSKILQQMSVQRRGIRQVTRAFTSVRVSRERGTIVLRQNGKLRVQSDMFWSLSLPAGGQAPTQHWPGPFSACSVRPENGLVVVKSCPDILLIGPLPGVAATLPNCGESHTISPWHPKFNHPPLSNKYIARCVGSLCFSWSPPRQFFSDEEAPLSGPHTLLAHA